MLRLRGIVSFPHHPQTRILRCASEAPYLKNTKTLPMLNKLRSLLGPKAPPPPPTLLPAGQRVYAIGDIHGRNDLLRKIITLIEADESQRGTCDTTIIFLGDLVDRGDDSAGVIETARALAGRRKVRFLAGNHEEMLMGSIEREETLRHFLRHGGRETLLSYGLPQPVYNTATLTEVHEMLPALIPQTHRDFITAMEDRIVMGDYVFVHAGIRPGVPIEEQATSDLRWIRGEFIEDRTPRSFAVVHGHTITDEPQILAHRIGIDTGAFASGRLTAIGLEGSERWLIEAYEDPKPEAEPGDAPPLFGGPQPA